LHSRMKLPTKQPNGRVMTSKWIGGMRYMLKHKYIGLLMNSYYTLFIVMFDLLQASSVSLSTIVFAI
jgi:hypothetical protein